MGLWKFLKWTFGKHPEIPKGDYILTSYQEDDTEKISLVGWDAPTGESSVFLELMSSLTDGMPCITYIEQWNLCWKSESRKKTEIRYYETFPARFAQEHLTCGGGYTRLTDGWREIFSVGIGADREMLEALYRNETGSTWLCETTLYGYKTLPDCKTLAETKARVKTPADFSIVYTYDEKWLDMTLPDKAAQVLTYERIKQRLAALGKTVLLDGEAEPAE